MMKIKAKGWWYIAPAYLTLWTVIFSIWSFLDGEAMMENFGMDTGGASSFIMLNSAARYIAISVGMILGIWVFKTYHSILLALLIRLTMDVFDLIAGLQSGVFEDVMGIIQSLIMFIIPNVFAIITLSKYKPNNRSAIFP